MFHDEASTGRGSWFSDFTAADLHRASQHAVPSTTLSQPALCGMSKIRTLSSLVGLANRGGSGVRPFSSTPKKQKLPPLAPGGRKVQMGNRPPLILLTLAKKPFGLLLSLHECLFKHPRLETLLDPGIAGSSSFDEHWVRMRTDCQAACNRRIWAKIYTCVRGTHWVHTRVATAWC